MKHRVQIAVGAILLVVTFTAQAATVSLTPPLFSSTPGGTPVVSTDVVVDFGTSLVQEGAFGIIWPNVLGTPTFAFESTITDNAAFADSLGGSAAFFIPGGMLMGPDTQLGTFTFPLTGLLGSGEITFDQFSEFFDETGALIDTDFSGTLVAVPLPAAGWLLLGGLGMLFAAARQSRRGQRQAAPI